MINILLIPLVIILGAIVVEGITWLLAIGLLIWEIYVS
jgi:hypothetical protein